MLLKETDVPQKRILVLATISGAANAFMLAMINMGADAASDPAKQLQSHYFVMFLVLFGLFYVGKKRLLVISNDLVENMLHHIRDRITQKIRRTNLTNIERLEHTEIHTRLTQETATLSQAGTVMVFSAQAVVMIFFTSLYIAYISLSAFFLIMVTISIGIAINYYKESATKAEVKKANDLLDRFFTLFQGALHGFKELKVNKKKSDAVFRELHDVSIQATERKIVAGNLFNENIMFAQVFWYALIMVIVFIMPQFTDAYANTIIKLTTAILFMYGPLEMVVNTMPLFAKANIAADYLYQLEEKLDQSHDIESRTTSLEKSLDFKHISLQNLHFSYRDTVGNAQFSVGPIDNSIQKGDIVFLIGGNGSGKSTFIRLLLGLYLPDQGKIELDGKIVENESVLDYRQLFSIVLSDFHLFHKLYGHDQVDEEKIHTLIEQMELSHKVQYIDGMFSDLNLSTGQKKRLALAIMLLENKPIVVLDEWAADQDPEFKKHFYEDIIQDFRAAGTTVIAVTHDDHYFHVADRIWKMEYGTLLDVSDQYHKA